MNAELLLRHFDRISEAPDAVARLRSFILDLAVRGKLVEQDPGDEPATELLKQIQAERARLIAEGYIKKAKPILAITPDEQPFDTPAGWHFVRLGQVLEMINGRAFKPSDWLEHGLPIVRIQNLNNLLAPFNYCDTKIVEDRHLIRDGDFLISWSGTPGTSFGAFIWKRGLAALNQHIFRCIQIGGAYWPDFLRLAINSQLDVLISQAQGGVGLQHVTKGTLEALPLPLPPLAEQHRIVAKVDELMALCDQLEAARNEREARRDRLVAASLHRIGAAPTAEGAAQDEAQPATALGQAVRSHLDHLPRFTTRPQHIKQLRQAIRDLAVRGRLVPQDPRDEPAAELLKRVLAEKKTTRMASTKGHISARDDLPDGWADVDLAEYALEVCTGPFGSALHQSDYIIGGIPLVNPSHMIGDRIVADERISVSPEIAARLASYRLRAGDIVMARRGEVGRAALVEPHHEGWLCGTGSFFLRFIPEIDRQFILLLLRSTSLRNYLAGKAVGTTMVNLNHGILKSARLWIPPLAEQHRIVAKVDELMVLCDQLETQLATSEAYSRRLLEAVLRDALAA